MMLAKPGAEFGLDEIAKHTGIATKTLGLLVSNLSRGKNPKIEKTSSGKHRAIGVSKKAAA